MTTGDKAWLYFLMFMGITGDRKSEKIIIVKREIFYFFSAAFLSLFLLEITFPNIVLAYFNLNYILIAWLVSGIINVIKK